MVRRGWVRGVVCVLAVLVMSAPSAAVEVDPCAAAAETRGVPSALKISTGLDQKRGWVTAEYGDLRIRKFTTPGEGSMVEFGHGEDLVVFELAGTKGTIVRNGKRVDLGSGAPAEGVQRLLGDSPALYHTRVMLSQLEEASAITPPEMTVLTAAAFAAAVTGDKSAPLRVSERFLGRHGGGLRMVRFVPGASCSSEYSGEVTDAWDDMMSCKGAAVDSWIWQIKMTLCELEWIARVESAWFEYLKCVGLLPIIGG